MSKIADERGGVRLAIMCIEYMVAIQKDQVDGVVEAICSDVGATPKGVMNSLQSTLVQLKAKEQSLGFEDDPDSLTHSLNRMVEAGHMSKVGDGYKLTVLGEVYAKHQITNDPESREFYRQLLESHGGDPAEDELLGDRITE